MAVSGAFVGLLVYLTTITGSITSAALNSPCPELFHYDSSAEAGKWSGTITLLSQYELHGVWLRLLFDGKLTALDSDNNFGEVIASTDNQEFLIKNREFLLKASSPVSVKITVKYEGDKAPRLIGYRLNAKMVCAIDNMSSYLPYASDFKNADFLATVAPQTALYKEPGSCGTTPLKNTPWQATLSHENPNFNTPMCEATLISSRHLLTPAHCVSYQGTELPVSVNRLRVNFDDKSYGVLKVTLHPGYRFKGLFNDLAVIQLDAPTIVDDYIRPICLGDGSATKNDGLLVGLGVGRESNSDKLEQAAVEIVNCAKEAEDLRSLLSDNILCAKYVQKDQGACVGGSGSSLVGLRDSSKQVWELKGVVTVGVVVQNKYACDSSSVVILIDVSRYLKWIQTIIS